MANGIVVNIRVDQDDQFTIECTPYETLDNVLQRVAMTLQDTLPSYLYIPGRENIMLRNGITIPVSSIRSDLREITVDVLRNRPNMLNAVMKSRWIERYPFLSAQDIITVWAVMYRKEIEEAAKSYIEYDQLKKITKKPAKIQELVHRGENAAVWNRELGKGDVVSQAQVESISYYVKFPEVRITDMNAVRLDTLIKFIASYRRNITAQRAEIENYIKRMDYIKNAMSKIRRNVNITHTSFVKHKINSAIYMTFDGDVPLTVIFDSLSTSPELPYIKYVSPRRTLYKINNSLESMLGIQEEEPINDETYIVMYLKRVDIRHTARTREPYVQIVWRENHVVEMSYIGNTKEYIVDTIIKSLKTIQPTSHRVIDQGIRGEIVVNNVHLNRSIFIFMMMNDYIVSNFMNVNEVRSSANSKELFYCFYNPMNSSGKDTISLSLTSRESGIEVHVSKAINEDVVNSFIRTFILLLSHYVVSEDKIRDFNARYFPNFEYYSSLSRKSTKRTGMVSSSRTVAEIRGSDRKRPADKNYWTFEWSRKCQTKSKGEPNAPTMIRPDDTAKLQAAREREQREMAEYSAKHRAPRSMPLVLIQWPTEEFAQKFPDLIAKYSDEFVGGFPYFEAPQGKYINLLKPTGNPINSIFVPCSRASPSNFKQYVEYMRQGFTVKATAQVKLSIKAADIGGYSKVPDNIALYLPKDVGMMSRFGVSISPNSFLMCVYKAHRPNYNTINEDAERIIRDVRMEISRYPHIIVAKQEMYDYDEQGIRDYIANVDGYLDPFRTITLLEYYFQRNIYIFRYDTTATVHGDIAVPRYTIAYVPRVKQFPKSVYIVLRAPNVGEFETQSELITQYRMETAIERNAYLPAAELTVVLGERRVITPVDTSEPVYATAVEQYIDSAGKTRILKYEDGTHIFTPPIPPLPIPLLNPDTLMPLSVEQLEDIELNMDIGVKKEQYIKDGVCIAIKYSNGFILRVNNIPLIRGLRLSPETYIDQFSKTRSSYDIVSYNTKLISILKYLAVFLDGIIGDVYIVKPNHNYGELPKVIYDIRDLLARYTEDRKLIVSSEKLRDRLIYYTKAFNISGRSLALKRRSIVYTDEFYETSEDFMRHQNEYLFMNTSSMITWSRLINKRRDMYMIKTFPVILETEPQIVYLSFREKTCIVQNVRNGDIRRAYNVSLTWKRGNTNLGFDAEPKEIIGDAYDINARIAPENRNRADLYRYTNGKYAAILM